MPLLGYSGSQYPYYHAQYANAGHEGADRAGANCPLPAGSRFDPLLGVVPITLGGSASAGWGGDDRMGLYGHVNANPYGRHLGLHYSQYRIAQSSSEVGLLLLERDSKAREKKECPPKRRRQPSSQTFEQIDEADGACAPAEQGTEKEEPIASSIPATVKLTRSHYEMLVEHHANLVNEIQETELMLSVYEQQANPSSGIPPASRSDESIRQRDSSTKKRPSPGKREVDAAEACSKKKRG
jgi:hypothetical protein